MTLKDGWLIEPEPVDAPPLSTDAERVIAEAGRLTYDEIVRLDVADREHADFRLVAWDVLRSRLQTEGTSAIWSSARDRAWTAVDRSLAAHGAGPLPGDDYWRVTTGFGWGAARSARFAACAMVAPERLEPEIVEILLRPWSARLEAEA